MLISVPWALLAFGLVPTAILATIYGVVLYAICWAYDVSDPEWNAKAFKGVVVCLLPFAVIGAIFTGERISWPASETINYALETKIAKAKVAHATVAEKERKREAQEEAQKKLASTVVGVAENIAEISSQIDDFKKSVKEGFAYTEKRMERIERTQSKDRRLLDGLTAPKPPEEPEVILPPLPTQEKPKATLPPIPYPQEIPPTASEEPPLRWVPVPQRDKRLPRSFPPPTKEVPPKTEEIPTSEPYPKLEHRAKATPSGQKRLVQK